MSRSRSVSSLAGMIALAAVLTTSAELNAQRQTYVAVLRDGTPRTDFKPHALTQEPSRLVTLAHLKGWEKELSNWGRWGPKDQRGTLNLITGDKTRQAAALVTSGISVSLQHFSGNTHFRKEADSWRQVPSQYWITNRGADGTPAAIDAVAFGTHDGVNSHMDALCHYWGGEKSPSVRTPGERRVTYNGYPFIVTESGCRDLGIDKMRVHYVTRGVLYDIPLMRKVAYLDPTTPIFVEDLEEWERYAGVKAGPGDVMIVRGGRWAVRDAEGPWNYGSGAAGLHSSVLPWLKARDIAVLVSDAVNDVQPSGVAGINRPIHQMSQVVMGLPIVDNGWPEDAAKVARQLKKWEFMVTWHNLYIPGGTASPWNAVATF